jgi:hypothetical protein
VARRKLGSNLEPARNELPLRKLIADTKKEKSARQSSLL